MNDQPEAPSPETVAGRSAPSDPEILNTGPPRNSKIAKLPRELRDLLNQMLADGATSALIIETFAARGISLNHQNICNWKHGGFLDWVLEQECLAEMKLQREYASDLLDSGDETKFLQAVIQLAVTQILQALKRGRLNEDPLNYTRLLNSLARLAREASVMRKYRDFCARENLQDLKRADPNRKLSDNDHQLFYGKVEELFRLKPGDSPPPPKPTNPCSSLSRIYPETDRVLGPCSGACLPFRVFRVFRGSLNSCGLEILARSLLNNRHSVLVSEPNRSSGSEKRVQCSKLKLCYESVPRTAWHWWCED